MIKYSIKYYIKYYCSFFIYLNSGFSHSSFDCPYLLLFNSCILYYSKPIYTIGIDII